MRVWKAGAPPEPLRSDGSPTRALIGAVHSVSFASPLGQRAGAPPVDNAIADTVVVREATVACDGGGGALGHPKVFLSLADGEAECPYCDRRFVLTPDADANGGGH